MEIKHITIRSAFGEALAGAMLIAGLCTAFDWLWKEVIPPKHSLVCGLIHGALLFAALGGYLGYLGRSAKTRRMGAGGGLTCGFVAAGSFYLFFPLLAFIVPGKIAYIGAMLLAWLLIWFLFASLQSNINGEGLRPKKSLFRGVIAAISSAPGFWFIIKIWMSGGGAYHWAYLAWTLAFLPALLALLAYRPRTAFHEA